METLSNLESFVRSAESASFSAAARRLGLTPAAVSRNVAQLERNLGVRLFQRSTRGLTLTEAGQRFLHAVSGGLDSIQDAIAEVTAKAGQPAGVLKLSAAHRFGTDFLLPMMPAFVERYPAVLPDWYFDNRQVDLIRDGFDAAVGGGFDLPPGVVARELARLHIVAVATPHFMRGRKPPERPADLIDHEGVVMRSVSSGRIARRVLRNRGGETQACEQRAVIAVNDPDALVQSVLMHMGIGLMAMPHVLHHLESGELVRILPGWYDEPGAISLYFTSQKLMPAKTRAFVDFVTEQFRQQNLAQRFLSD
ncbi:LysR family transcriptional regulator [Pseudoduganella umbonata]|uniref:DNA-binding transcriptional LysR family regulator n=1 Tax=Pseudoduganella umbonata TaxID=864828 RepID=A0A4V1EDQ9_9BURK|nr:LysR family transcriptional regulator [Pseudoduganella umbonata]MBB3220550.1 DNA-binding transcriptional LysR family regulator [Pseudoduganella umbonata]QCP11941.1 LysR family transcriptional regulator [Pseudoduganella umbonata]